jgi:hypothetical protein
MSKSLLKICFTAIFFLLILVTVGCKPKTPTITSIEVDLTTTSTVFDVDLFDLSNISIKVHKSNQTFEIISLNPTMISNQDLSKLSQVGIHTITINYMNHTTSFTIELAYSALKQLLISAYNLQVIHQGFIGSYDDWVLMITGSPNISIIHAQYNHQGQLILTLSDQRVINLGSISNTEIFTVTFYGFYGEMLSQQNVLFGQSATPPNAPLVVGYIFINWDQDFSYIIQDLEIYAVYRIDYENVSQYDQIDDLFISINRLNEADFNINFDQIFTQSNQNSAMSVLRNQSYQELSFHQTTRLNHSPFILDQNDYLQHVYWQHTYYHQSLYQMPSVIDGMHVLSYTLNSYNNHALGNLYVVASGVAENAKNLADWAVDHLKMVDTWINYRNVEYLLHYDQDNDVVELYSYYTYEEHGVTSFEKIAVYFNENNEEVIEFWVTQKYTKGDYRGVTLYYNSIAARDFNYYQVYFDENFELEDQVMMRGVNLNQYGLYEYYENNLHMISGDYGWYTVGAVVQHDLELVDVSPRHELSIYTPDGFSNVISYYKMNNEFKLKLYLPSFNGLLGLLVEEGMMMETNQDSLHVQDMLRSYGFSIMPNWYVVDKTQDPILGFETNQGRFLITDSLFEHITMEFLDIDIGPEGIRGNDRYYSYFGILQVTIHEDNLFDVLKVLSAFLKHTGLSYKYGDTDELFFEAYHLYENYETYAKMLRFTNDSLNNPNTNPNPFVDYESYLNNFDYVFSLLNQIIGLTEMLDRYPHIDYSEMNQDIPLDTVVFFDLTKYSIQNITINSAKLDTSSIDVTIAPSPLLQKNQAYTIVYVAHHESFTEIIGHENFITYQMSPLHFEGNQALSLPTHLPIGDYTISAYFAKVIENGFIRLSNLIPLHFASFDETHFSIDSDIEGVTIETKYKYQNNRGFIESYIIDHLPPTVIFDGIDEVFFHQGDIDLMTLRGHINVMELISKITVVDNYDYVISVDFNNVYYQGVKMTSFDDYLVPGSYEIIISDASGNQTKITIHQIEYIYQIIFYGLDYQLLSMIYVKSNQVVSTPEADIYPDDEFIGWDTDLSNIESDLIVTGIYQKKAIIDIMFLVDGSIYHEILNIQAGSLFDYPEIPTKPHHEFAGWFVLGESLPNDHNIAPKENLVLYGKWIQTEYQILLNLDGGTLEGDYHVFIPYQGHFELPIPELEGTPFRGWFYSNQRITNEFGQSISPWNLPTDVILTAVYYHTISTYEDLVFVSENLNGRFKVINHIDLLNRSIHPIGSINAPFTGRFDGSNYIIRNITITSNQMHQGLFGVNQGRIANLRLQNITFPSVTNPSQSQMIYVGGIAGMNIGEITNSKVEILMSVIRSGNYIQFYVGGLIGYQDSTLPLFNNLFHGEIYVHNQNSTQFEFVGGVIGYAQSDVEIINTTSTLIYTNRITVGKELYVGGVIGKSSKNVLIDGLIANIRIESVISTQMVGMIFGGVIGHSLGTTHISQARVLTTINERTSALQSILGGFIGRGNTLVISDSQGRSSIYKHVSSSTLQNPRTLYASGVVGTAADITISNTIIENNMTLLTVGYNQAQIYAGSFAGSAGIIKLNSVVSSGAIRGEAIILTNTTTSYGLTYIGGFVGHTQRALINSSRSFVSVDAIANTGSSSQTKSYAGGMIGFLSTAGSVSSSHVNSIVIARGFNGYAGGISGYAIGLRIKNSISDANVTGKISGGLVGEFRNGTVEWSYTTGTINGSIVAGGIIGILDSSTLAHSFSLTTVRGNIQAGHLFGTASILSTINIYKGPDQLVTTNTQTIVNPYILTLPSTNIISTLRMKSFVSYEHLLIDQDAVWIIGSNGIPVLYFMS